MDRSPAMKNYVDAVQTVAGGVYDGMPADGQLSLYTAGTTPTRETKERGNRASFVAKAIAI